MPKKVVYFLGAGATHAEIQNLQPEPDQAFNEKYGLLITNVSKRVLENAQTVSGFTKELELVTSPNGRNIELLISLFESNRISDRKIKALKQLVEDDIQQKLTKTKKKRFYLHKALFELHDKTQNKEELTGLISLNYDDVLDDAYRLFKGAPNYCLTSLRGENTPLLKLHGSFDWNDGRLKIYNKRKTVAIIPLGIHKNYLSPPYNFIWGRALELLIECNTLRIIGCSLNQNDIGLIDLLFKAHLDRETPFDIEIIDFQKQGQFAKNNYGFLPNIIEPEKIEGALIGDEGILGEVGRANPFRIWLKAKAVRMIEDQIPGTKFLKKCL